ncbi:MAG: hypothetical protein A2017_09915 [Lentisphaerae bacterium GWF2_44_16]|nr:MAG: hypothetical protein A2017_09915 [Lentisphaerae bacterium GWF2_44_16]
MKKDRKKKKLFYCRDASQSGRFSKRKKDRMGFLLRQINSYSRILRELQMNAGESRLYRNRFRDCEYEVYKMRNLLRKKGLADDAFFNDELE